MNTPKISVVIPTYNYAHFLDDAIQSVLTQSFTNFELIISDNHSTDNTDEVVAKYLHDNRVSYFKNDSNLGLVGNWNKCLDYATGDYVKFLCADDKFHPQLLQKFVDVVEEHPTVTLVTTYRQYFGGSSDMAKLPFTHFQKGSFIIKNTLSTYGWLGEPSAVMFKRNPAVGYFNPANKWLVDWEMWLRQLAAGDAYIVPEPLAYIRNHESQVTKTVINNYTNYFEEYYLCKAIKEHDGYNIDTQELDMKRVVKMRAAKCAKALYKMLPTLYNKQQWQVFKKAFNIAFKERVLLQPINQLVKTFF